MRSILKYLIILLLINEICLSYQLSGPAKPSKVSNSYTHCSRRHSRFVREYFARALLPIYQKYDLPVPDRCPFSPLHDIYHNQENNKSKLDTFKWKCEMCGKFFTSEEYLDKHLERKHNDTLQKHKYSVCLANHCRIFRCDVLMKPISVVPKCYEGSIVNLQNRCIHYLDQCIPGGLSYDIKNKLTAELRENLCSYLTCGKYYEQPGYMSKGPSFLVIFLIVFFIGFGVVAYGIITHTDIIYDENETLEPCGEMNDDYPNIVEGPKNVKNPPKVSPNLKPNSSDIDLKENFLRKRILLAAANKNK